MRCPMCIERDFKYPDVQFKLVEFSGQRWALTQYPLRSDRLQKQRELRRTSKTNYRLMCPQ